MDEDLKAAWEAASGKLLFPPSPGRSHPYYIVAPQWVQWSAGVRALYLLCHVLNRMGHEAYISHAPYGEYHYPWTNHELRAPLLQEFNAQEHFVSKLTPIVLYPETVGGNPLHAPVAVRWILNFPGALGGDKEFPKEDICFGYCQELAASVGQPDHVLHLPTVDTRLFHPPTTDTPREGGCFFASKYRTVHNGKLFPVTDGCAEITRLMPDSPTPREVADLLRRSEIFYAYENTALATEALLCGCPAVFLPNEHLTELIASKELGPEGYAWGADPGEIARAKNSVAQGAINYLKTYDEFHKQLGSFIALTQERAAATPFATPLTFGSWPAFFKPPEPSWFQRCKRRIKHSASKRLCRLIGKKYVKQ